MKINPNSIAQGCERLVQTNPNALSFSLQTQKEIDSQDKHILRTLNPKPQAPKGPINPRTP